MLAVTNNQYQIVLMAEDEAREKTEEIKHHLGAARALVVEIHQREGWRALGYDSFEQWAQTEFPQYTSPSTIYRMLKAGRLELSAGGEIGEHRESHLRQIFEFDGLDEAGRIEALTRADELAEQLPPAARTARLYENSAKQVYVQQNGRLGLVQRMVNGELAAEAAHDITVWLRDNPHTLEIKQLSDHVSDVGLLPVLARLQRDRRQTWDDIWFSTAVPTADGEMVPLSKATAQQLINYLEYAAKEHRISAVEARQWEDDENMRIALENHVAVAQAAAECLSEWYPGRERPADNPDQKLYDWLVQLGYINDNGQVEEAITDMFDGMADELGFEEEE